MLSDIVRRVVGPAEKVLTHSFRFAGWVAGRAVSPVFARVRGAGRPAVHTLSKISPAAAETIWTLLPGTRPADRRDRVEAGAATPGAAPVAPRHVAVVPTADEGPAPATAHAEATVALAHTEVPDAEDLPVRNWDGLTIPAIRQRTRALGEKQLLALLAYERAHGSRPAVMLNLENRLAKARRATLSPAARS